MKLTFVAGAAALAMMVAGSASAAGFTNGTFETGDITGWTQGGGYRAGVSNASLSPSIFGTTVFNDGGRGAVITNVVDPRVGAALGSTVYGGTYAYRAENTSNGGYATFIQQQVNNYTDASIFFAWKSVLEGAHGLSDAATMIIKLTDLTLGTTVISREYNAAASGGGVDSRFSLSSGGYYYTKDWQIEELKIDATNSGHDFLLSVLAADCEPTGHLGYVYLDGFGARLPDPGPGGVPEPATWAMLITGFGLAGATVRRRRASAATA